MPKIARQYSSFVISKSYFIIRQKQKKKTEREKETNPDRTSKFTMFVCLNQTLWHRDFVINESRHRSQKTDQRYWTKFKVYQISRILFRHFHNIPFRSTIFFPLHIYVFLSQFFSKEDSLSLDSFFLVDWKRRANSSFRLRMSWLCVILYFTEIEINLVFWISDPLSNYLQKLYN